MQGKTYTVHQDRKNTEFKKNKMNAERMGIDYCVIYGTLQQLAM